ncbi:hypothetical protein MMC30_002539 [Trapelia coarctata]|nr:hypothetical protein [Trapelia coarctata]
MLFVFALLFGLSVAQRPSNASICDYYAKARYGANNSDTQFELVQSIVSLAFGGKFNLTNVSSEITGILNPGIFKGDPVYLRPWFDGTLDSTNLNDQPIGIDWLDSGALDPLYNYLSGVTKNVTLPANQLFQHFFVAFSYVFGCSSPPKPPPSNQKGPVNLAYVHKYMNLNYTDLGHFIDQLTASTTHFGFSDQDSQTLNTKLNSLYNVRCAPPITLNPRQGPQLLSLCQADTCPLAAPSSDCEAYVNLTAAGYVVPGSGSAAPSTVTLFTLSPTATGAATATGTSSATAAPADGSSSSSSSMALSTGAIVGIAIGAAALVLLAIAVIVLCLRRRKAKPESPPAEPRKDEPTPMYSSPPVKMEEKPNSYVPNHRVVSELYSPPAYVGSPEMSSPGPVELGGQEQRQMRWGGS